MKKHLNKPCYTLLPTRLLRMAVFAFAMMQLSCNIINPAEPIPAYVHIDSIPLSTTALQGSNSNKIIDAWVYVDGNIIGTFEMPVTFPVLATGMHKLTIRPGILLNGIAATRVIYPFYAGFDTTVNFESGKIIAANPKITYASFAQFKIEDFDQTGTNIVKFQGSDTLLTLVPNGTDNHSFEGKCGAVYLDDPHNYFICAWKDSFPLPLAPSFLELNYLSDNDFTVGIITYNPANTLVDDVVTFTPSTGWRKEYVNLTPYVQNSPSAYGFKIYLKATKNPSLANASLYFDNIKVVH